MTSNSRPSDIDPDEPPLFDLGDRPEIDPRGDILGDEVVAEGVRIPPDIVAIGNGKLPEASLKSIGIGPHRLHETAADGFARLRALAAEAGIDLTCTDSYRTFDQQVELKKRKPEWSATPGRSVHGWGFAVDVSVGSPPKAFGQSVLRWLEANGPPNGWFLGRPKDEPWHWVYRGTGAAPAASSSSVRTSATPATTETAPGPATGQTLTPADRAIAGSDEITLGATGIAVTILRRFLALAPSDTFDAETDTAVRAFQSSNALTVDGKVGPKTWAALRSTTAPADRTELKRDAEGDAVRWVQTRLGIAIDGRFGEQTEGAVKRFQLARGLGVDGKVGPKTWAALSS